MLYFEYEFAVYAWKIEEEPGESAYESNKRFSYRVSCETSNINENLPEGVAFFVSDIRDRSVVLCGAVSHKLNEDHIALAHEFMKRLEFTVLSCESRELTVEGFANRIYQSSMNNYIYSQNEILNAIAPGDYDDCTGRNRGFTEFLIETGCTEMELQIRAERENCTDVLSEEIGRIYAGSVKKFVGHPVHYLITSDDSEITENIVKILTSALYQNGRLKSRRTMYIKADTKREYVFDDDDNPYLNMRILKNVLEVQGGCATVIQPGDIDSENEVVTEDNVNVEELAKLFSRYKKDCLGIFVFSRKQKKIMERLKSSFPGMRFVEIEENMFGAEKAREILEIKALRDKIDNVSSLLLHVPDDGKTYYASDVNAIYYRWLEERLSTEVFTQYNKIKPCVCEKKPSGDAYAKLQNLIGLESVKKTINRILDYHKVCKLYEESGFSQSKFTRHMIFTGNPGTAKTTVARLFARIMKDNRVLSEGELVEVGRQDLVGKYVGWTARCVEEAFARAKGSVLFIDEAYSLCDEKSGSYGDEAINTIVQLMENNRNDTVVIFAGYPDKMDEFLKRNPGLRSRIAYHVNFDDYSTDELMKILKKFSDDESVRFAAKTEEKVRLIFEKAKTAKDFGNGRFARNLFEQARMRQASRIITMPEKRVTERVLHTLVPDDFVLPDLCGNPATKKTIGFVR